MFWKKRCPFCDATINTLEQSKIKTKWVEVVDGDDKSNAIRDYITEIPIKGTRKTPSPRTVPRIFIGAELIGGNSELQDMYQNGELGDLEKTA